MNAQDEWKQSYIIFKNYISRGARENHHKIMRRIAQRAALERIIAAQQRTIEAQEQRIVYLEQHQHNPRVSIEIHDPRWSDDGT